MDKKNLVDFLLNGGASEKVFFGTVCGRKREYTIVNFNYKCDDAGECNPAMLVVLLGKNIPKNIALRRQKLIRSDQIVTDSNLNKLVSEQGYRKYADCLVKLAGHYLDVYVRDLQPDKV